MAKKKTKKKVTKKAVSFNLNFIKSKEFLLTAALMLSLAVVVGFFTFAGSNASQGRVFSWKKGTILYNGATRNSAPADKEDDGQVSIQGFPSTQPPPSKGYQYVTYTQKDWKGKYLGVYTEKSNPAYGSRDLAPGKTGEDVGVLKQALTRIGTYTVTKGTADNKGKIVYAKMNELYPALSQIDKANLYTYDVSLTNALKALDTSELESQYGLYLKDNQLNKYEQVRILSLATDPGFDPTSAMVFDVGKSDVLLAGKSFKDSEVSKNAYHLVGWSWSGKPAYLAPGETTKNAYPTQYLYVSNSSPSFGSRSLGPAGSDTRKKNDSGGDVKVLQSMLKYIEKKHGGDFSFKNLKVNGTYDQATRNAVRDFQVYYGIPGNGVARVRTISQMTRDINWPVYYNKPPIVVPKVPVITPKPKPPVTTVKLTTTEVKKHNKTNDCWLIYSGNVYNLTGSRYLSGHPGGSSAIRSDCGVDITSRFNSIGHSQNAKNSLGKLLGKVNATVKK